MIKLVNDSLKELKLYHRNLKKEWRIIFDGRYEVFFYGLGSYLVESFGNQQWHIE